MMRAAIACLAVCIPFAAGCPTPADCRPNDAPTLEIGWGEEEFVPFEGEEPTALVIHGEQLNGYHVPIALNATGLYSRNLVGSDMKGWLDGELHSDVSPWVQLRCNPHTGTLQSWNNRLAWDIGPPDLDGRLAHIEVTLVDIEGRTASAEADVRLVDPPVPPDTGE